MSDNIASAKGAKTPKSWIQIVNVITENTMDIPWNVSIVHGNNRLCQPPMLKLDSCHFLKF